MKCRECKGTGLQNDYFDQVDCYWKPKCKSCLGTGEVVSESVEICVYENVIIGYATSCKMMSVGIVIDNFKYCPYCGKPIKIKDD